MKLYQAYNICIASELPLPELMESEGKPDVIVQFGKINDTRETQHDGGNTFQGEVAEVGKFFIQRGREVVIDPVLGVEEALLRTILLGPILSILLRQRGLLVLHASCVDINNKAVAFMGGSGWGKSTLAAAFHTKGYDILTDDVMPIEFVSDSPIVIPAYPQFKLFPEAVASLGQDTDRLSPVFQNSPKLSYKFERGFQQTPLPLQRIYVLDKGSAHKITKLQPQEAFVELVRHTRAISLVTNPQFVTSHMRLCSELINNVTFCRFTRKPSLTDLPELVKLIEDDLAQINTKDFDQKMIARVP
ncbi:hypothetical protein SAMD00079811_60240 [Scytonema sp. HK-05]|uniref:hypothetical protein n=1 Tax=Scytonema sp. HK-05 TaxID=1137095 RepID=UPI000936E216|nr:hypothetical protein [Scytonema sp. HK-05]OKH58267.1 hypothetical protein NIES2130_15455 [Scytonema sp. HK-05]BAY48401.1 hypothetical protein SAMD00079811_60240 [Scytonema sp. HK-05]